MSSIQKQTTIYESFAGLCAVLVGIGSFLYAIAFIILVIGERAPELGMLLSSLCLTLIGLFSRLRETDATFALLTLLLGIAGALDSAVHGGYDLANAINPPATVPADLPSQIDPHRAGVPGLGSAVLLIILYLGRLIALDPTNPVVLVPALLSGFPVNPAWYIWLGVALWTSSSHKEIKMKDVH